MCSVSPIEIGLSTLTLPKFVSFRIMAAAGPILLGVDNRPSVHKLRSSAPGALLCPTSSPFISIWSPLRAGCTPIRQSRVIMWRPTSDRCHIHAWIFTPYGPRREFKLRSVSDSGSDLLSFAVRPGCRYRRPTVIAHLYVHPFILSTTMTMTTPSDMSQTSGLGHVRRVHHCPQYNRRCRHSLCLQRLLYCGQ